MGPEQEDWIFKMAEYRSRQTDLGGMEDKVLSVNRIAKKIKGGEKIGFASLVVVGDKKGKVGLGYGKAADLRSAIEKAQKAAKKAAFLVPLKGPTIARRLTVRLGAAEILFKPAPRGAGLIAGGVVRDILNLVGVRDVSAKILGTNNSLNNAKATIKALKIFVEEGNKKDGTK